MSEIDSFETRGNAQGPSGRLMGVIRVVAGLGIAVGTIAAIFDFRGWGLPSAFVAFVVLLSASAWPRR